MAVLGVTEHHIAGLPDGALADHAAAGIDWVGRLLDDVRPDTIVTFGADGITFHPDHVAVHHWVTQAWCERGRPGRLLYAAPTVEHLDRFGARYEEWGIYMGDERPTGVPAERLAAPRPPRRLASSTARSPRCARWRRRRAAPSPTSAWRCTPT